MSSSRCSLLALALALVTSGPAAPSSPEGTPAGPLLLVERLVGDERDARRTVGQWLTGSDPVRLFVRPHGVAWSGDDLVVTDPGAGRVVRVNAKGRLRATSADGLLEGPIGVASCPWGVAVTDSKQGTVTLLDAELRPVRRLAEGLSRPTGVACDDRRIFVVETGAHRVLALRPEGGIAETFGRRGIGEAEFNFPVALACAGEWLWIGDTLNFRLQGLRAVDGEFLRSFGRLGDAPGETPRIKGVAVDRSGRIWVTDAHLSTVAVFRATGDLLLEAGGAGAGPGEFLLPAGLAAHDDGRVAVVDSLNRRVQVLRVVWPDEGRKP